MTDAYARGFASACARAGLDHRTAAALLKAASADPQLDRATAVFQDWLSTRRHQLRPGETLSGVARRYGVGLEDLMAENNMSSPNALRRGQVLRVPVPGMKRPRRTGGGANARAQTGGGNAG